MKVFTLLLALLAALLFLQCDDDDDDDSVSGEELSLEQNCHNYCRFIRDCYQQCNDGEQYPMPYDRCVEDCVADHWTENPYFDCYKKYFPDCDSFYSCMKNL